MQKNTKKNMMDQTEANLAYHCYIKARVKYQKLIQEWPEDIAQRKTFIPLTELEESSKHDVYALLTGIQAMGIGLHITNFTKDCIQGVCFDNYDMDLSEYKKWIQSKVVKV